MFAQTRFSVGVGIGAPGYYGAPYASGYVGERPPCPGPGYDWVDGYYGPNGGWIAGYWAAPRYYAPARSYGYYGGTYFRGDFGRGGNWDRGHDRGRDYGGGRGQDFRGHDGGGRDGGGHDGGGHDGGGHDGRGRR